MSLGSPSETAAAITPVKPADAASLIATRVSATGRIEVLLGQRSASARFMPGVFVAPGGRVEDTDRADTIPCPLHPSVLDRLMRRRCSRRLALALARSALREMIEETGILFAQPRDHNQPIIHDTGGVWRHYCDDAVPPFADLDYVVRALTPTARRSRFNTRFFLLHNPSIIRSVARGDGELELVDWYPFIADDLDELPMAGITRMVLREADRILRDGPLLDRSKTLRIFHSRGRKQFAEE